MAKKSSKKTDTKSNNSSLKNEKLKQKLNHVSDKFFHKYLVIRSFTALSFFFLAHLVLSPLKEESDLAKVFLIIFALIIIGLSFGLIVEYVYRTLQAQTDKTIIRYSGLTAVNSIIGLFFPIIFIKISLGNAMDYFAMFPKHDSFWCELRWSIIEFYKEQGVYWQLDRLAFWILVLAVALFIFGGAIERLNRK